jgi:hypothetical protein
VFIVRRIVLGWPGNDLLSRVLRHSTIGAEAFNGRVRDGIGFRRLAQVTGPAKNNGRRHGRQQQLWVAAREGRFARMVWPAFAGWMMVAAISRSEAPQGRLAAGAHAPLFCLKVLSRSLIMRDDQADRAISTGQLNASPRLHIQPINVVVFHGPDREFSFRGGFPA